MGGAAENCPNHQSTPNCLSTTSIPSQNQTRRCSCTHHSPKGTSVKPHHACWGNCQMATTQTTPTLVSITRGHHSSQAGDPQTFPQDLPVHQVAHRMAHQAALRTDHLD